ncbi:hypothetical protein, partial [Arthrobacter sp. H5]|uniref:hypothetical protein n=1 Tax=Arthrobacter sp. H5 TaxID=1267973 RepID=UPI00055AA37E
PAVIDGLADELPSREDAHRYLDGFARLLPQRLADLGSRLEHGDIHGASNVLLSVNVGAVMVGAARLGYVSTAMLDTIDSAGGHLDILIREADAFLASLPNGG